MQRRKENLAIRFFHFSIARRLSHLSPFAFIHGLSILVFTAISFSVEKNPSRNRVDTVIPAAYLNNDIFFFYTSLFPFNGDAFVTVYHSFFCILIRLVSIRFMRNDARRRPWTINRTLFLSVAPLLSVSSPFSPSFLPFFSLSLLSTCYTFSNFGRARKKKREKERTNERKKETAQLLLARKQWPRDRMREIKL